MRHETRAEPGHWSECGRAVSVGDSDVLGRPHRSVLSLGGIPYHNEIERHVMQELREHRVVFAGGKRQRWIWPRLVACRFLFLTQVSHSGLWWLWFGRMVCAARISQQGEGEVFTRDLSMFDALPPNHALQRTRPSRPGCKRTPSWAGSLSLGRSAASEGWR